MKHTRQTSSSITKKRKSDQKAKRHIKIMSNPRARTYVDSEYVYGPPPSHVEQESPAVGTPPPAPLYQWADHNCKFALEILDAAVLYQSRSSINDVPRVCKGELRTGQDKPESLCFP